MSVVADFAAIDLETANPDAWSICQIGVAQFDGGQLTREWMSYIDPAVRFNPDNVAIHGITAAAVRGWPKLADVAEELRLLLDGRIVVSHSQFDRVALEQAFERLDLRPLGCSWLDSTMVARRAWQGFSKRGFGLENLCRILGYRYQRHDALGDAKAAGVVVLAAIEQTGLGLEGWLEQVELPIGDGPLQPIRALTQAPAGTAKAAPRKASRPSNAVLDPETLKALTERFEERGGG